MIDLSTLPPLPWTAIKTFENGWGFEVLAADGQNLAAHEVWGDDAALMATIHAFGPRLLAYVCTAAEKGGVEALAIVGELQAAKAHIEKSPEELTRLKRQART